MRLQTAQIINLSNGRPIATLSEGQLEILRAHLYQESETDTNFSITPEMVDDLRQEGAIDLATLFGPALRDVAELRVGYAPVGGVGSDAVRGRLLDLATFAPLVGYKIEIYDRGLAFDELIAWCYADGQGRFDYRFKASPLDDAREIELRVFDLEGKRVGSAGASRDHQANFGDLFVRGQSEVIAPVFDSAAAAICPSCGALFATGAGICNDCQVSIRRLSEVPIRLTETKAKPKTSELLDEDYQQELACPVCETMNQFDAEACQSCGCSFSVSSDDDDLGAPTSGRWPHQRPALTLVGILIICVPVIVTIVIVGMSSIKDRKELGRVGPLWATVLLFVILMAAFMYAVSRNYFNR